MKDLKQRALGTLVSNAVFSPLSGLIIAAGIVLVALGVRIPILGDPPFNVPSIAWLAGLIPAWLGVVGVTIASKRAGEEAVSQIFREQFDINGITSPNLRTNIAQAIAYRERIDKAADRFTDKASRGRVQDVANQIEEWVGRIYTLAKRLDTFRNDSVIRSDLQTVPDSIKSLKTRLAREDDPAVQRDLNDTISRRQAQFDNLKSLESTMERAELQLENTLTSLGTVYSQILLVDAGDVNSSKTQRLRDSISEQVNSLQDLISSMDQVYGESAPPASSAVKNLSGR